MTLFEEVEEAYETLYRKPGVERMEGLNDIIGFKWKVYRVAGDIIRIDINTKG